MFYIHSFTFIHSPMTGAATQGAGLPIRSNMGFGNHLSPGLLICFETLRKS